MKTKLMGLLLCLACALPLAAAPVDDEPAAIRVDLNRAGVVELMELQASERRSPSESSSTARRTVPSARRAS